MLTEEEMNALIDAYQKVLDARAENLTYDETARLLTPTGKACARLIIKKDISWNSRSRRI